MIDSALIAEQFFQLLARRRFMFVNFTLRRPSASDKFKILVKVVGKAAPRGFRGTIAPRLDRSARNSGRPANPRGISCMTRRAPAGVQRSRLAAIVAMPRHFIFDLRFAVDDFRMILNGHTIRLRFNVQSWQVDKFRLTLISEL
jgi:hypothetical protein